MQIKLSIATATLLLSMNVQAQDFVSVQYLQYNENDSRTAVSAPSILINKDLSSDYTLKVGLVADSVSGASQTYHDSSSGASAYSRGTGVAASDVKYGNINYEETRVAGDIALTTRLSNRDEFTLGISRSNEEDYYSSEISSEYMHWLDGSKNQSVTFSLAYQANEILDRCPAGSPSTCDSGSGASQARDATAINGQVSYSQNIDATSSAQATLFVSNDDGFLTNPYLNVVRNYNGVTADVVQEKRPDKRTAYGAAFNYANALNDTYTLHLGYRFYKDDWDINSHTIDSDLYIQANSSWLFKLGLRAYVQSNANFYNEKKDHFTNEVYASSDERLSDFNALTYKASVDYKVSKDLTFNLGANFYDQSTNLSATYFVTGFTYNF
ncbi:DUF3570 domain-containing protein [Sulfurimonas sp.]|nr:DUF3570 domain-containing protein [Sulfurimonas sp.]